MSFSTPTRPRSESPIMGEALDEVRRSVLQSIASNLDVRVKIESADSPVRSGATPLVTGPVGLEVAWKTGEGTSHNELVDRSLVHSANELKQEVAQAMERMRQERLGMDMRAYVPTRTPSKKQIVSHHWDPPKWLEKPQRRITFPRHAEVVLLEDVIFGRGVATPFKKPSPRPTTSPTHSPVPTRRPPPGRPDTR